MKNPLDGRVSTRLPSKPGAVTLASDYMFSQSSRKLRHPYLCAKRTEGNTTIVDFFSTFLRLNTATQVDAANGYIGISMPGNRSSKAKQFAAPSLVASGDQVQP